MTTAIVGPHRGIAGGAGREKFLAELFDTLWDRYRERVSYVQTYEKVIREAKATFVNDHIAFRTFATQQPLAGIASISRIFEALGYRAAGSYHFDDKQLSAIHFQHANQQFPKLFISELKTWELPAAARGIIEKAVRSHRPAIASEHAGGAARTWTRTPRRPRSCCRRLSPSFTTCRGFCRRRKMWRRSTRSSQYAAWVLVHGYNVNHFTSLINSHGVPALDDIEKTIAALQKAGVPMKAEIEGERGSKLRQTATEAVTIDVAVHDQGQPTTMPWTYAYFELAQRDLVVDPASGKKVRFEGFLGPQATNLFEMTKVK